MNAVIDHSVVEAWWSSGCPVCVSDSLGVEVCLGAERSPQRGWRSMEAPNGHCCRGPSKPSSDCARVIRMELGYHCRLAGLEGFPHPTGTMLTPAERGEKKRPVLAFAIASDWREMLSVHLAEHSLCRHFWVCLIGYFFFKKKACARMVDVLLRSQVPFYGNTSAESSSNFQEQKH